MNRTLLTHLTLVNLLLALAAPCSSQATAIRTAQTSPGPGQRLKTPLPFGLEDGTPIRMRITRTISSADAKVDERVDFEVLEEIKVGDVVVVPRGAIAWATVTEAQPKRRMARGGKLNVNIDAVRLASGEKAPLRAVKEMKGGGHTGAMTGAIVATSIVFFPAAPLFLFMHGKDITIPKGTEITAYINGDISLDPGKFSTDINRRPVAAEVTPASNAAADLSAVSIKSNPEGADILIDGKFVGNAPSTVRLVAGDHVIRIEKSGFKAWQRQITVNSAGNINVEGILERDSGQLVATTPNHQLTSEKSAETAANPNPEPDKSTATAQDAAQKSKSERPPTIVNLEPFPRNPRAESVTGNPTQRNGPTNRVGQEVTTDLGKDVDSFLFATTFIDHLERCRAEKAGDAKAYNRLKDSGRLRELHNKTKVVILDSKKDPEGREVFEVRIPATGKTVWIESKFIK